MKTLHHNDLIRLPMWDNMTAASVFSLKAFCVEDGNGGKDAFDAYVARGEELADSIYTGSALCADRGYYDREKARVAGAVTIEHGEIVEIDGNAFQVKIRARCLAHPTLSNPIQFVIMSWSAEAVKASLRSDFDWPNY